jgi:hypothetical protein
MNGTAVVQFKILGQNVRGKQRRTSVRIGGVPDEIRNEHLSNTNLQRYRDINLPGNYMVQDIYTETSRGIVTYSMARRSTVLI